MTDIRSRLDALAAAPRTHRVVTLFSNGKTRAYDARNVAEANAFCARESRAIGHVYKSRDGSADYSIVNVYVEAI